MGAFLGASFNGRISGLHPDDSFSAHMISFQSNKALEWRSGNLYNNCMTTIKQDLAEFMLLMDREMENNSYKGGKSEYIAVNAKVLLADALYHAGKLAVAIKEESDSKVEEHAADVANLAMMALHAYRNRNRSQHEKLVSSDRRISNSDIIGSS